jgi:hypothetical protein
MLPQCGETGYGPPTLYPFSYEEERGKIPEGREKISKEIYAGGASILVTKAAYLFTKLPVMHVLFVSAISFTVTTALRNLFKGMSLCVICEREAQMLIRKYPYAKVLLIVIAVMFVDDVPIISRSLSIGLGIILGLTHHITLKQYYTA